MSASDLLRVLRAAEMAADWHVGQRRKGAAQEPYINHLLEVARLVGEATGGADGDLVIAALLHDAIEDCEVSGDTIEAAFGADVRALVEAVTAPNVFSEKLTHTRWIYRVVAPAAMRPAQRQSDVPASSD